jgi:signal transduction histidine kinase/putative methionine-R-sulfoxide reductase with GAF domain
MRERRIVELTTLNEISKLVNSTLELDDMLREIVTLVCKNMLVDVCSIYLIENRNLVLRATQGLKRDAVGKVSLAVGEGITGAAAAQGSPAWSGKTSSDPRFVYFPETGEQEYSSILSVPLISRGNIIGVINIRTREEREYQPLDIQFLTSVAGQVSGAIRNSQLYLKATRNLHELITLNEVGKIINSTLDKDKLLQRICEMGANVLNCKGAILRMLEDGAMPCAAEYHESSAPVSNEMYAMEKEIAEKAVETRLPQVVSPDEHNPYGKRSRRLGNLSLVAAPIILQENCTGSLSVYTYGDPNMFFSVNDRRLLVTLTSQASVAIENARLFESVKKAQSELEQAHEELMMKEKLAALGGMAAGVAHELRNPLVSIGGFAQRIVKLYPKDLPDNIRQHMDRYVGIITGEVKRLEHLVSEMLNYASPQQPQLQRLNLPEFIDEVLHSIDRKPYRLRGVSFETDFSQDSRDLDADPDQLRRALLNLIVNGCEAMPHGGVLSVTSNTRKGKDGEGDYLEINISDTGEGISRESLIRLFDPFFSTKATGSGLGLPITKSIIETHKGVIKATSTEGEGSLFSILLPKQNHI